VSLLGRRRLDLELGRHHGDLTSTALPTRTLTVLAWHPGEVRSNHDVLRLRCCQGEGLAARPLRWSVTQASGQRHDHSRKHAVGEWSPEHRPRRREGP
jgi:hypothetical protein